MIDVSPEITGGAAACRLHTSVALLMLGVVAGTCLFLSGVANSAPVLEWMRRASWEQNRWKKQIPLFCYTGHFTDYEERFLHEEVPSTDYSRGGVYFLGASTMKWAVKTWDLPPETRPLIHDFAFGGVKHSDEADFIRFLVEDEGLLRAGPEKTFIIFGMNYRIVHHGRVDGDGPGFYFRDILTRHGFYTIDDAGTIHRTGLNPLIERLILERYKLTGLLREVVNLAYVPFKSIRVHDRQTYLDYWAKALGPNWEKIMDSELAALRGAFAYLRQRQVKAAVFLLPMGSWDKDNSHQAAYVRKLRPICDAEGVKIYDYSKSIDDDDFADSDHLTPTGIEKFQRLYMGICLDFLRSAGLLPADYAPNGP